MKDFDAQQAREILQTLCVDELNSILMDIKSSAEQGEGVLHVYKSLKTKTLDALIDKGFIVKDHSQIAIQRDGLYHSIYWA
jgi:hypothetical protein